jgi:hypothetical protein
VVKQLYELLKPGGELVFFEHHRSHDAITRTAQCEFVTTTSSFG